MSEKRSISKFGFFSMTASLFITVYEYPTFANSGKSLIFFLLLCGLFWFLPVALCSAELSTVKGYQEGGIFSWVGKNLGVKFGFAAIFFQWFQITVGFVTMIYFIIGTLSDVFNWPALNSNLWIKFAAVLIVFWVLTLLQFNGTQVTEKIAKYGFSIGIIVPVLVMFGLVVKYLIAGNPVSTNFSSSSFLPNKTHIGALVSFVLAYMGVEASAPHITELEEPKKNYPMIMLVLVVVGMVLSTIGGSVVSIVLKGNISSNSGVVDAFKVLLPHNNLLVMMLGILISFGVMAQVSSWIVSPTEGLQFVATKGLLPPTFEKKNKAGVPVPLLILQGILVSIWAAVLTFGSGSSGGNIAFQTAISLTVVIYLCAYLLFFISYFVLIYKKKNLQRDYQVPGGIVCKTILAGCGFLMSVGAIITAFIRPSGMSVSDGKIYLWTLAISLLITLDIPFLIYSFYGKKHQKVEGDNHENDEGRV
jgi:glutamate:gamma-aminobutyrate antiporter